jgi:hypothetical protein
MRIEDASARSARRSTPLPRPAQMIAEMSVQV